MGLMPDTKSGKVAFVGGVIAPFSANAVAIGTTAGAVTALNGLLTTAQTKMAAQVAALAAAKTATAAADNAVDVMAAACMDIVAAIRAKAKSSATPAAIYELAEIPAPATPTPVGSPGTPTGLKVALNPDGSIKMTWTCANPAGSSGTLYNLFRSTTGASSDFAFIGGSGEKKFTDATVPSGVTIVYYKIQAVRTTAIGVAGEFTVRFGMGGSAITVTEMAPKLAA
jgi:hypothetical protein